METLSTSANFNPFTQLGDLKARQLGQANVRQHIWKETGNSLVPSFFLRVGLATATCVQITQYYTNYYEVICSHRFTNIFFISQHLDAT